MDKNYSLIKKLIETPKKSVLILHRKPDGDSISSNLALYQVLKQYGHEISIYSKDTIADHYKFLPEVNQIKILSPKEIKWNDFDLYWALDSSTPNMIGEVVNFPSELTIITIDHHFTNPKWGKYNLIDYESISTTSVLYKVFNDLNIKIIKDIATCLLTGLTSDSGSFSYSKDSESFKIAADLIDKGANYQNIIFNLEKQIYPEDLQFVSKALENLTIYKDKQTAVIIVPYSIWKNYGKSEEKNEYLKTFIQSIKGTKCGILIIEDEPKKYRIELRSRISDFDVSRIALELGGGGHKAAAGAKLENLSIKEVVETVLKKV